MLIFKGCGDHVRKWGCGECLIQPVWKHTAIMPHDPPCQTNGHNMPSRNSSCNLRCETHGSSIPSFFSSKKDIGLCHKSCYTRKTMLQFFVQKELQRLQDRPPQGSLPSAGAGSASARLKCAKITEVGPTPLNDLWFIEVTHNLNLFHRSHGHCRSRSGWKNNAPLTWMCRQKSPSLLLRLLCRLVVCGSQWGVCCWTKSMFSDSDCQLQSALLQLQAIWMCQLFWLMQNMPQRSNIPLQVNSRE